MFIKRFRAGDTQSALHLVKEAMGPDAVILSTRELKNDGGPGTIFEITAGVGYQQGNRPLRNDPPEREKDIICEPAPDAPDYGPAIKGLESGLAEVKDLLLDLTHRSNLSERMRSRTDMVRLYRELLDAELDPAIARVLVEKMAAEGNGGGADKKHILKKGLAGLLMADFPVKFQSNRGPSHVTFVGPSGVGKTTTLAKLAAYWSVKRKKKVALISLDTFRLGAAEQLRTYARIMGLPVRVVQGRDEFFQAIDLFENMDLVLIDTSGRSLLKAETMRELNDMIGDLEEAIVLLVISAVTKDRDIAAAIQKAEVLAVKSLVVTKIDETQRFGNVINNLIKFKKPVSFLTNGQKVPDDLIPATPSRLAELISIGACASLEKI